jgi:very-long-chain (3R)-3-hydroxyacyl-CoA dehydratase
MVLAWSLTEVIRYSFYATSLVSEVPYALLYLRYTTFFVLYPLGAGSEAFLIYSTLPSSSPHPVPTWRSWVWGIWTLSDYIRGIMFLVWWPGKYSRGGFLCLILNFLFVCLAALYVLYTHMMKQRRRVLGTGQGRILGSKKTQ